MATKLLCISVVVPQFPHPPRWQSSTQRGLVEFSVKQRDRSAQISPSNAGYMCDLSAMNLQSCLKATSTAETLARRVLCRAVSMYELSG